MHDDRAAVRDKGLSPGIPARFTPESSCWSPACAAAALGACGDGGSGFSPPPPVNVTGAWSFNIKNLTTAGLGFSCAVAGTMQLTQTGASFDGTYHVSSFTCTNGFDGGSGDGSVVSGTVFAGDSVHFHFDIEDLDQHGVVSAGRNSVAGISTWVATDGSTVTLKGNWTAHR